jgi:hypothetical protein
MSNDRLHRQIDKVADLLGFVVLYDPEALYDLEAWFREIARLAVDTGEPDVAVVASAASKVTQKLLLRDDVAATCNAASDQEGGSLLNLGPQRITKEYIRDQIAKELLEMATEFRISKPVQSARARNEETLMVSVS